MTIENGGWTPNLRLFASQLLIFWGGICLESARPNIQSTAKTLKVMEVTFLTSHVHRLLAHPWVFNETLQGVVISVMVRTNAPHVLHHSHVVVQVGIISSNFAVSQHTGLTDGWPPGLIDLLDKTGKKKWWIALPKSLVLN